MARPQLRDRHVVAHGAGLLSDDDEHCPDRDRGLHPCPLPRRSGRADRADCGSAAALDCRLHFRVPPPYLSFFASPFFFVRSLVGGGEPIERIAVLPQLLIVASIVAFGLLIERVGLAVPVITVAAISGIAAQGLRWFEIADRK